MKNGNVLYSPVYSGIIRSFHFLLITKIIKAKLNQIIKYDELLFFFNHFVLVQLVSFNYKEMNLVEGEFNFMETEKYSTSHLLHQLFRSHLSHLLSTTSNQKLSTSLFWGFFSEAYLGPY